MLVNNWCPYLTYTWTSKQVNDWVEHYGSWAFYDGVMWDIKPKKIPGSKFYTVSFTRNNSKE